MSETITSQASLRIGRYEIFDEIASGGMATVHIGRLKGAVGFSRMVAVKRLHTQFLKDRQFVTMFVDEARLAARIRHPNVVPMIDVVQTNEELFLVMEYVQGASLARAAAMGRKNQIDVPISVAAAIVAGVLHGLHAAHEAKDDRGEPLGIVHRDVSPQNVLVGVDGVARVLDFGIAKAKGRIHDTAEGVVKGKLAYMAPEQVGGADLGREADIYAAGVILWELLAGRRLHAATTEALVLASVLRGVTDPPSRYRKGIPQALDQVVMKALALDPEERYPTARDLALALEELIPLASAARITCWLEQVADDVLQRSAIMVANVDGRPGSFADIALDIDTMTTPTPPSARRSSKVTLPEMPPTRTDVSMSPDAPFSSGGTRVSPRARRHVTLLALAAIAVIPVSIALFGVGKLPRHDESAPQGVTPAPPPRAAAAPPVAVESPSLPVVDTAAPIATAPLPDAAPSHPERVFPVARRPFVRSLPSAAPAQPSAASIPSAPRAPAAKADCDPPYTLDSRGIQRLKPQCL